MTPIDVQEPRHIAVWTDTSGYIREASQGAAQLLGVSRRGLTHRLMYMYVRADRARVLQALERVGRGHEETVELHLQPKERRRVAVRVHLTVASQAFLGPVIRWAIHPVEDNTAASSLG